MGYIIWFITNYVEPKIGRKLLLILASREKKAWKRDWVSRGYCHIKISLVVVRVWIITAQ